MRSVLLIVIIIMLLAGPAMAQSTTYHHEVRLELEGEWEWNGSFIAPEIVESTSLKGVGKAIMHSITKAQTIPVWWDLF